MKSIALIALSAAGLLAFAAPARADDISLGWSFGGSHGDRGFVGFRHEDTRFTPAPRTRIDVDAAPYGRLSYAGRDRRLDEFPSRATYIPGHEVVRQEEVCEPALYEDRMVPVYEERTVPVFEARLDFGARHPVQVQVGVRTERVRVGERVERVLVREAFCHTVSRIEWVPGHYADAREGGGHDRWDR